MITQKELKDRLHYDPDTGIFIWRKANHRRKAGEKATAVLSDGYIGIRINNHLYRAHRLAWLYVYGVWPENSIDHIDRNPQNNAIRNLRDVSHADNCRNTKPEAKGYYARRGGFTARIRTSEGVKHLGFFRSEQEAATAYQTARRVYHPTFNKGDN